MRISSLDQLIWRSRCHQLAPRQIRYLEFRSKVSFKDVGVAGPDVAALGLGWAWLGPRTALSNGFFTNTCMKRFLILRLGLRMGSLRCAVAFN